MRNDRDAEVIKAAVRMKGMTLTGIGARARPSLSRAQICRTLTRPFEMGERLIAKALGEHPRDIWPSRYDETGIRHKRQPLRNYRQESRFRRGGAEK